MKEIFLYTCYLIIVAGLKEAITFVIRWKGMITRYIAFFVKLIL